MRSFYFVGGKQMQNYRFACIRAEELNLRTVTGKPELVGA